MYTPLKTKMPIYTDPCNQINHWFEHFNFLVNTHAMGLGTTAAQVSKLNYTVLINMKTNPNLCMSKFTSAG